MVDITADPGVYNVSTYLVVLGQTRAKQSQVACQPVQYTLSPLKSAHKATIDKGCIRSNF